MTPEEEAREKIDKLLIKAGWKIQDYDEINLGASIGVVVREFPLTTGFVDYLIFVDRKAVGVIEAKPFGTTLSGVAEQSDKYLHGFPEDIPHIDPPRFAYESTGIETMFRDEWDSYPRSRRVFSFHTPLTLKEWLELDDTLRSRLQSIPPLDKEGLWDCQVEAITNLEESFSEARPKALIQMATGSGKTFTAVNLCYRLIKFAKAKRILFLVDRSNLGRQALNEFQQFDLPQDGRKFTKVHIIQHLTSNVLDHDAKVCITTIQRLYSMLKGEEAFEEENEEYSMFEKPPMVTEPVPVGYNRNIPIGYFDFIIIDECHRSIYNLWRQVLEYFDAFLLGLTATPSKLTIGFFNRNLVMEYNHERAVADGVNVGYQVYRIRTKIGDEGSTIPSGFVVDKRDKITREVRQELLDEEITYTKEKLDRAVVSIDQIRTVTKTFKDKLFTEIFPGRTDVPKTLVFAKTDSHAEDIVNILREEFGKGNEFCKKITYRTTGEKPETLIKSFRNSYYPRIAVTVDMISTGTDIKPLECLLFMRDVKSRVYFEQMKGRGTRTIKPTDFQVVTRDAKFKTEFIIVDAVGVTEGDKTDSKPLERKRFISFEKLLQDIAVGRRDEDRVSTLAGRLARLDKTMDDEQKAEIVRTSGGKTMPELINDLLGSINYDTQIQKAKEDFKTEKPTKEQIEEASEALINEACGPFDQPALRNTLIEIKKKNEQVIDKFSLDEVVEAKFDGKSLQKAQGTISTFKQFIEDNKDELTALQVIFNQPYNKRQITFKMIKTLSDAIKKPPYNLNNDLVWKAYEQLEKTKVKGAGPVKVLIDIISLIRFAIGEDEVLMHYPDVVDIRFDKWLNEQKLSGREFNEEQTTWLEMIKEHIASSGVIELDDLFLTPFHEKGGAIKAKNVFDGNAESILNELNEVLVG